MKIHLLETSLIFKKIHFVKALIFGRTELGLEVDTDNLTESFV
jgi:hypothetical protein